MFLKSIKKTCLNFWQDQVGSFAIMFAVSLLLIMIAAGVAMDISKLENEIMEVQHAADAAVLAGVKEAESRIAEGATTAQAYTAGRKAAELSFTQNMTFGQRSNFNGKMSIKFSKGGEDEGTSGVITFSGKSDTMMGEFIGVPKNNYAVGSSAVYTEGIVDYIELHILVDTSASMGLPSTNADQVRLGQLKGCSFACHGSIKQWRAKGITFRIDVVRDGVKQIMEIFKEKGYEGERLAVSIYTFGNSLHDGITSTIDLDAAKAFANTLDLGTDSGTNTGAVMKSLAKKIGKTGTGANPESRKDYIAIFTDGLTHGTYRSGPRIHSLYVTAPEDCTTLKADTGATLFIFNVEYIANLIGLNCPNGHPYCAIQNTMKPSIKSRMTQCATEPEYALPAETPRQIENSVELFAELIEEQALAITR